MTQNQLRYWENQERIRSNKAQEAETQRANLQKEHLKSEEMRLQHQRFNRSNWHSAISSIGRGVSGVGSLFKKGK